MSARGWLLFAVMSVVWGIPYLLIKVADEGVSTPVVVFTRTAIGAIVLLPAALHGDPSLRALRGHWPWLVAFAAAEVLGPWWLLSDAERQLPSSLTGLFIAAVPIVGVLLGRATGGSEQIGVKRWAGLLLGLTGVALLVLPDLTRGGIGNARAIGEVGLVVFGYSIGPLITARRLTEVPGRTISAASLSLAAILYAPAAIATRPDHLPPTRILLALAVLGIVCTTGAFLAFFALIREVGPSRAMVFTYLNPAIAIAAGVIFLREPLRPAIIAAFALILAGSALATAATDRKKSPATYP